MTTKTKTKISQETAAAIDAAVSKVAGRKEAFIHSVADIIRAAEEAEARLEALGMAKTHRTGAKAFHVLSGPGKSYKWSATGTDVAMIRGRDGWTIDAIGLCQIYPGRSERLDIEITAAQHAAAIAAQLRDMRISIARKSVSA